MKKKNYHIVSFSLLGCFAFYWAIAFLLTLPPNPVKHRVVFRVPSFQTFFGGTWNFFTPPYPYNNRLYYITRTTFAPYLTDTLEVLEKLASDKQSAAPFNQREAVIDHQVNNILTVLIRTTWRNQAKPGRTAGVKEDSSYVARAMNEASTNVVYQNCLGTLNNYALRAFHEKGIDLKGKELKILVREKFTTPMRQSGTLKFPITEVTVLETPFKLVAL